MLSLVALSMILIFMIAIMTKRLSAMVALVLVPIIFALLLGHAPDIGSYMIDGIKALAPTGIMLIFAILFFGTMIDAGLFRPVVSAVVAIVGSDPVRIAIGTVVLAFLVGLDGDGTTTYMITIAAMLPIYRRLGLDVRILACLAMMTSAVSNTLPWGGPTARAATALNLDAGVLFRLALPAMLLTLAWVLILAFWFGRRERIRLSHKPRHALRAEQSIASLESEREPWTLRHWFNLSLTLALLVFLILGLLPLPVLFVIAFCIALAVNHPRPSEQSQLIANHAGNALNVGGLVFAAGIFTGILNGTGMVASISNDVVSIIPPSLGLYFGAIIAAVSIPLTYLVSNDAFYFGTLPILAHAAGRYGFSPEQSALASLVGQQFHLLSPLVPSTYLLVGLVNIDIGEHLRFTAKWALVSCVVFFSALIISGTGQ